MKLVDGEKPGMQTDTYSRDAALLFNIYNKEVINNYPKLQLYGNIM